MKTPAFSEFSFGYAFTENLIRWLPDVTGVPIFPSLSEEGKLGVGYDVKIPRQSAPVFLQYKIPQIVTRRSNLLPPGFTPPYFRMHFHSGDKSSQHRSLVGHSRAGRTVFYVCPKFTRLIDLDQFYRGGVLPLECFYVDPKQVGDLDDNHHFVAFDQSGKAAWLFSEPKNIEPPLQGEGLARRLRQVAHSAPVHDDPNQSLIRLANEMLELIRDSFLPAPDEVEPRRIIEQGQETPPAIASHGFYPQDLDLEVMELPPAARVALLARHYMCAEVVFVGPRHLGGVVPHPAPEEGGN